MLTLWEWGHQEGHHPVEFDREVASRTLMGAGYLGYVRPMRGFIAGSLRTWDWSDELCAYEHILYVAPDHRHSLLAMGLLQGFYDWAEEHGAGTVSLTPNLAWQTRRDVKKWIKRAGAWGFEMNTIRFLRRVG